MEFSFKWPTWKIFHYYWRDLILFLESDYSLPSWTPFFLPVVPQGKKLVLHNSISSWQTSAAGQAGAKGAACPDEGAEPTARVVLQGLHSHFEMSAKWARLPNVPVWGSSRHSKWELVYSVPFIWFLTKGTFFFFVTKAENGGNQLFQGHIS